MKKKGREEKKKKKKNKKIKKKKKKRKRGAHAGTAAEIWAVAYAKRLIRPNLKPRKAAGAGCSLSKKTREKKEKREKTGRQLRRPKITQTLVCKRVFAQRPSIGIKNFLFWATAK
jgi:hypothetical protein